MFAAISNLSSKTCSEFLCLENKTVVTLCTENLDK